MEIRESVKNDLLEDEHILWSGVSKDFKLINKESKKNLIVSFSVNALLFILLSVFICSSDIGFSPVFEICCFDFFFFLAYLPVQDYKQVKKCVYYISDKRIIISTVKDTVLSLPRKSLKMKKIDSSNGGTHIVFGGMTDYKVEKLLMRTSNPLKEDNTPVGLCFYNIECDNKIAEILSL